MRVRRLDLSEGEYLRVRCLSTCWRMVGGIFHELDASETCLMFSLGSYRLQTEVFYTHSEPQPISVSAAYRRNGAERIGVPNYALVQIT